MGELEFFRHDIAIFSPITGDGIDRYKPYNSIYNIYDKFAPEHLNRVKDAVVRLPAPGKTTGLSFTASEFDLETNAQANLREASSQDEAGLRIPT